MSRSWRLGDPIVDRNMKDCALGHLETLWTDKNCDKKKILTDLKIMFAKSSDPCSMVLYFLAQCYDCRQVNSNTLTFFIIKHYDIWVTELPVGQKQELFRSITDTSRLEAFESAIKGHCIYLDMIIRSFDILSSRNVIYIPYIDRCIKMKRFKEAAQCTTVLRLQDHFGIEEILIPLIAQDKMATMEKYLESFPTKQQDLLKKLDEMCLRTFSIPNYIQRMRVPEARMEKLNFKTLSKLAMRLLKMFGLPETLCVNISNERKFNQLKYLLHKKYEASQMVEGDKNWDELIESVVVDDVWLRDKLIDTLQDFGGIEEASKWAVKLSVPFDELPELVKSFQERNGITMDDHFGDSLPFITQYFPTSNPHVAKGTLIGYRYPFTAVRTEAMIKKEVATTPDPPPAAASLDDWDADMKNAPHVEVPDPTYFHLTLDDSEIIIVDTVEALAECADYLSKCNLPIGLDAEWRPVFTTAPPQVSLVQLGTHTRVFLVDVHVLRPILSDDQWIAFFRIILCDENVTLLGYGIDGDLRELSKTIPCIMPLYSQLHSVIDISFIHDQITKAFGDAPPNSMAFSDLSVDNNCDNDFDDVDFSRPTPHRQPKNRKPVRGKAKRNGNGNGNGASNGSAPPKVEKGLSELVLKYLGKPLCKFEQMSDWGKRPLRREQMRYAALDAVVLVLLHQELINHATQIRGTVDFRPAPLMRWMNPSKGEKKRKAAKEKAHGHGFGATESEAEVRREVFEIRLVVDEYLTELVHELRSCGIDVTTATDKDSLILMRHKEERKIVVRENLYNQVKDSVTDVWCHLVNPGIPHRQCLDLLRKFNLKVTMADVYTRCMHCNCDKLMTNIVIPNSSFIQYWAMANEISEIIPKGLSHAPDPPHPEINYLSLSLKTSGIKLQLDHVPVDLINRRSEFFCCVQCGWVLDQDTHFTALSCQFKDVLNLYES